VERNATGRHLHLYSYLQLLCFARSKQESKARKQARKQASTERVTGDTDAYTPLRHTACIHTDYPITRSDVRLVRGKQILS